MIALDTNLLVYAHRAGTSEHQRAARALERARLAPGGWGWAQPVVAEFWRVVTHPASQGGPTPPAAAAAFLRALMAAGAQCWRPTPGSCDRLLTLADREQVPSLEIFDLEIALIARDNGAREIWSQDRHFRTVAGLKLINPLA